MGRQKLCLQEQSQVDIMSACLYHPDRGCKLLKSNMAFKDYYRPNTPGLAAKNNYGAVVKQSKAMAYLLAPV